MSTTANGYPDIVVGRTVRLPSGHHWCGSSLAHSACRFKGRPEGELLHCDADGRAWSNCPYHAAGFVNVYAVRDLTGIGDDHHG